MSVLAQNRRSIRPCAPPSPRGVLQRSLYLAVVGIACLRIARAVVFSAELDAEVTKLHAASEEHWIRIGNLTAHLQSAGAISGGSMAGGGLPGTQTAPAGAASGLVASGKSSSNSKIAPELVGRLRQIQSESVSLQGTAFRIGRESSNNEELSQHPEVNEYISNMREFNDKLVAAIRDLEKECDRITGAVPEAPKKKKSKKQKTIKGLSEAHVREVVQTRLAGDERPYRTRAMDLVSTFRERQLQMQDKQRDLQLTMDGPDWPKEEWPLTTADAQHVGDAELLITQGLAQLNAQIDPLGGLARVYESNNEQALEQLAVLSEMISAYVELIDRHVTTVKKTQKGTKKKKTAKQAAKSAASPQGGSLRDQLLSFGKQPAAQQPLAWLGEEAGKAGMQPSEGSGQQQQQQQVPQGFGNLAGFGGLQAGAFQQASGAGAGSGSQRSSTPDQTPPWTFGGGRNPWGPGFGASGALGSFGSLGASAQPHSGASAFGSISSGLAGFGARPRQGPAHASSGMEL